MRVTLSCIGEIGFHCQLTVSSELGASAWSPSAVRQTSGCQHAMYIPSDLHHSATNHTVHGPVGGSGGRWKDTVQGLKFLPRDAMHSADYAIASPCCRNDYAYPQTFYTIG